MWLTADSRCSRTSRKTGFAEAGWEPALLWIQKASEAALGAFGHLAVSGSAERGAREETHKQQCHLGRQLIWQHLCQRK